ncbi:thiamine diphosphokinase [Christensenellaceae bacterium OttesenSCG-928-K19]|nr:thiamine diphosphokinase [Christensenellaceae bacterium OttesenSCG-928-K19]
MNALIVAAGTKPPEKLLEERAGQADIIVAADGGLAALREQGIWPDLVVGDFDSVDRELVEACRQQGAEVLVALSEKNETDTQLALSEAVRRGAKKVCLLGATGGRIDHLLSNIMLLKWSLEHGIELLMEDGVQTMEARQGNFEIYGESGQTVSILPVDDYAEVTAKGLYYPLDKLVLRNDVPRGVSNVFVADCAKISTEQPVLIIKIKKIP